MKMASRYLLPTEMFIGLQLVTWGMSGWFGGGSVHDALVEKHECLVWGISLMSVGSLMFLTAFTESCLGRYWSNRLIMRSVSLRCIASFLAAIVWMYMLSVALSIATTTFSMLLQSPLGIIFSCMIYFGNYKVRYVLNPRTSTVRLQQEIIGERQSSLIQQ